MLNTSEYWILEYFSVISKTKRENYFCWKQNILSSSFIFGLVTKIWTSSTIHDHEFFIISFPGYQYAIPFVFRISSSFVTLPLVFQSLSKFQSSTAVYTPYQKATTRVAEEEIPESIWPWENTISFWWWTVICDSLLLNGTGTAACFPTDLLKNQSQTASMRTRQPNQLIITSTAWQTPKAAPEAITTITSFACSFRQEIKYWHR